MRLFPIFCVALGLSATSALAADKPTPLGTFKNWSAYTAGTGSAKTCYALSQPVASDPKGTKRDPIYFLISDWPGRNAKAEPEIVPGYTYKDGSPVTASVGSDKFNFFSKNDADGGSAWLKSHRRRGTVGRAPCKRVRASPSPALSSHGTATTDAYSLAGISATRCKRPMPSARCKRTTSLIGLDPATLQCHAYRRRDRGESRPHARAPIVELDLCPWRARFRRDEQSGERFPRRRWPSAFTLERGPKSVSEQISNDGTRKWLLRAGPGIEFETVFIPEPGRGTLCVSRQVGCTLNCRFCHTGTQKLVRNLTPAEIVGQVMIARDALGDWPSTGENRRITNVVMMGMGEPLYNFDNVKAALAIVIDGDGAGAVEAPRHAFDGGRRADDPARGRGNRLCAGHFAACRARRSPRRDRADQQEISDRRTCSPPAAPIPASPMRGASPLNM